VAGCDVQVPGHPGLAEGGSGKNDIEAAATGMRVDVRQGTQILGAEASDEVEALLPLMFEPEGAEMCETWKAQAESGREGAAPTRQLNFYSWDGFCKSARKGDVAPTVVIDFPYGDQGGLNLEGDERLLERIYVFKDASAGGDRRVVLHVHTPLRWGARGEVTLQERVKRVTSVNVRHAVRGAERFEQEQGNLKMPLVPVSPQLETGWREMWRDGSFARKCTWLWGKAESMPTVEDERVAARNYDQVRFAPSSSSNPDCGPLAVLPEQACVSDLIAKPPGKGMVSPTVLPTVGRRAPRPSVLVGALRPTVNNTVKETIPFPGRFPMRLDDGTTRN